MAIAGRQVIVELAAVVVGMHVHQPIAGDLHEPAPMAAQVQMSGVEAHSCIRTGLLQQPGEFVRMSADQMGQRAFNR